MSLKNAFSIPIEAPTDALPGWGLFDQPILPNLTAREIAEASRLSRLPVGAADGRVGVERSWNLISMALLMLIYRLHKESPARVALSNINSGFIKRATDGTLILLRSSNQLNHYVRQLRKAVEEKKSDKQSQLWQHLYKVTDGKLRRLMGLILTFRCEGRPSLEWCESCFLERRRRSMRNLL